MVPRWALGPTFLCTSFHSYHHGILCWLIEHWVLHWAVSPSYIHTSFHCDHHGILCWLMDYWVPHWALSLSFLHASFHSDHRVLTDGMHNNFSLIQQSNKHNLPHLVEAGISSLTKCAPLFVSNALSAINQCCYFFGLMLSFTCGKKPWQPSFRLLAQNIYCDILAGWGVCVSGSLEPSIVSVSL